jgi:hypothetical protein
MRKNELSNQFTFALMAQQTAKLAGTVDFHDDQIKTITEVLRQMMVEPPKPRAMGFHTIRSRTLMTRCLSADNASERGESMRRPLLSFVPLVLIGLCIRSSLIGAEGKAEKEESARRLAEMKKTVEPVELTIGKAGSDKLTRVEEPIQRWSHPLVRIVDAMVFLWTRDGRLAVVAQAAEVTGEEVWRE